MSVLSYVSIDIYVADADATRFPSNLDRSCGSSSLSRDGDESLLQGHDMRTQP